MYVRLGLANPKEGMTEDALNYFRDVAIPVYDQVSGLLGAAACINNAGQLMAWTTWVNNEAKEAAMSEFQQNLSGLADFITEPPTILEGPMVAGQQYIMVPKDGEDPFFARFVLGGGTKEGKKAKPSDPAPPKQGYPKGLPDDDYNSPRMQID